MQRINYKIDATDKNKSQVIIISSGLTNGEFNITVQHDGSDASFLRAAAIALSIIQAFKQPLSSITGENHEPIN